MQIGARIDTGAAQDLLFADESLWVLLYPTNPDVTAAVRIDPRSGKVTGRVEGVGYLGLSNIAEGPLGMWGASAMSSSGECDGIDDPEFEPGTRTVYMNGELREISECDDIGGHVARIDTSTNALKDVSTFGDWVPGTIAVTSEGVWLIAGRGLVRRAPGSRRFTHMTDLDDGSELHVGFGSLWVLGDKAITRIRTTDATTIASIPVSGSWSLAFGPDGVWATTKSDVVRIDPTTNQIVARIPVTEPFDVAADGEHVVVSRFRSHELHRIDPRSNRVVESIDVGAPRTEEYPVLKLVAFAAGSAWVMNGPDLLRVDFTTTPES